MAKLLILDGHCSAALAFVRSLGRAGHWTAVGYSEGSFAPSSLSRYCRLHCEYPNPINHFANFIERIKNLVQKYKIDLVIPLTDATIRPLSCMRDQFKDLTLTAIPNEKSIELVCDKYRTITLAKELGIPVPKTMLVCSEEEVESALEWRFPLVIKDRFSIRWHGEKGVPGRVTFAYSQDELFTIIKKRLNTFGDVLVQEFCDGVGIGFSCFIANGKVFLPFQWQRIREKDPRGSGSSARKSLSLDSQIEKFSYELLVKTDFEGIAMVEFKKDTVTGELCLMEINGRPWGSMQLPIHCNIDYPRYLVNWYLEAQYPQKKKDYQEGITCRWLVADFLHLENLWEGKPVGWPVEYPNFFSTLLKVSLPFYPKLRYDHLSLFDPKPGIAELVTWLKGHL